MVVPAACVIVLQHLRGAPGLQQVVHLVLLPPGQRLAQDLPRFVHVEVPGSQEPQYVFVLRDLIRERTQRSASEEDHSVRTGVGDENATRMFNKSTERISRYLPLVRLLQPFAESDEAALL